MDNRFPLTGTVTEISEPKKLTQYLTKKFFKLRFTDTDFAGKIQERIIKLETINQGMNILEHVKIGDLIKVMFYVEGRDFQKEGSDTVMNFTSLVCYDLDILMSDRDTIEDKEAVITAEGKKYKVEEATDEDLAYYDEKMNTLVLKDPNKPLPKPTDDDPFPVTTPRKDYSDLLF